MMASVQGLFRFVSLPSLKTKQNKKKEKRVEADY